MPRTFDSDVQKHSEQPPLLRFAELVDCPACEAVFIGVFFDPAMDAEDMVEAPSGEHTCPNCAHVFETTMTGWHNYGDA